MTDKPDKPTVDETEKPTVDETEKLKNKLLEKAEKLGIELDANLSDENLKKKVEYAEIERYERIHEEVRQRIKAEAELKSRIAEIKASADLAHIAIDIPAVPDIMDVVRLEKELKIKREIPKPSPETLAIEKSKKVYALFRNLEQEDVDIVAMPGGKYRFHLWPEQIHVLPEWLILHYRSNKNPSGTRPDSSFKDVAGSNAVAAQMVNKPRKARFTFEILGDAPKAAKFGIVTDETILSELEQPV